MYRDSTIGVVVPAYNEEGLVGEVIDTIPTYVDRVYVVDDASTDGTWGEIRTHTERANAEHDPEAGFDRRVVPIQHDENRGVGGAIKTGYRHALRDGVDVTAVMGGDGQMDPDALPAILDPVVEGRADYAKGNRFMRGEDLDSMPQFRLVGNALLSFLTKVASGYWTISDPQNGYTAVSSDALREADIEEMYEYYGYCNDLLIRLNAANLTVADVAHSAVYEEEESHITYREYIPRVSGMLLDGFLWRLNRKYLVQEFNPLALAYYAGAGATGLGTAGVLNALRERRADSGWVATVVLGVVLLIAGMAMDRAENRDREVRVTDDAIEPGASAADDNEAAPDATAGAETGERPDAATAENLSPLNLGANGSDGNGNGSSGSGNGNGDASTDGVIDLTSTDED